MQSSYILCLWIECIDFITIYIEPDSVKDKSDTT